jgi:hypothetical protein
MDKPRIFLGSSGKQEKLLQALTRGLEDVAHVDPWTTSFNPGTTTLDRLVELAHEVDFAAFVFARDDWTTTSPPASPATGSGQASPRDAPQLDGTGEILLESADRASGYFTTHSNAPASLSARTAGVYWRAQPGDMSILDGSDDRRRAELIAERLAQWKSITNA